MLERDDAVFPLAWGGRAARDWYTGGLDPYGPASDRSLGFESLRGSRATAGVYAPPPPRVSGILRNPNRPVARGLYQPATVADYESRSGQLGTGGIHPIYEADEDGDAAGAHQGSRAISPDKEEEASANASDPFLTPTGGGVRESYRREETVPSRWRQRSRFRGARLGLRGGRRRGDPRRGRYSRRIGLVATSRGPDVAHPPAQHAVQGDQPEQRELQPQR